MTCGYSTPTPAIQVNNISVLEGQKAVFTVALTASNTATTVNLSLLSGSANIGSDVASAMEYYNGSSWVPVINNTVTVGASSQSRNFQVRMQTIDDTVYEGDEQFSLRAVANNVTATGTATINDNDVAPVVQSVSSVTVTEGQQAVFTIALAGVSSIATNVQLNLGSGSASIGNDVASNMQVSFDGGNTWSSASNGSYVSVAAGVQSLKVRVNTNNDTQIENTETFTLTARTTTSMYCGGTTISSVSGTGTILDNDSLAKVSSVSNVSVTEGNLAEFTVGLASGNGATTVQLVLAGGSATAGADYTNAMQVSFDNGTTWSAVTGSAVSVAAGVQNFKVRVQTIDDTLVENTETFSLTAKTTTTMPCGGITTNSSFTGTASILDNDVVVPVLPTLNAIATATALEGNNVVFTVGLSGTSTTATTVDLVLTNGTTSAADFGALEYFNGSNWVAATNNKAIIAAGQTSVQVRTLAVADGVYEGLESFTLKATANGSTQTGNGSITDVAPTLNPISAATALEGNNVVFTVGLSGTSTTATTVDLVLTNGTTSAADLGALEYFNGSNWVAATGNKAIIAAGQTSVQVRTLAIADGVYEGAESFTLKATANGSTQTGNGLVTDVAPTLAPIAAATALEGNQVVFTVGLSGTSTTATTVDLVLTNGTTTAADLGALEYFNGTNWVAATNNKAIIAAGQTSVQVRTLAIADGVYEGLESFTLQATANGSTQSGQGSVTDVAPTLAPIAAATALEGNQVVFTVGLSGASTTATTVDLALSNGTTSSADLGGLEYFNGSNWVAATGNQAVIAAGQTSVQVRTLAVADGVYEGLESFTLQASANGSTQTANGSVTDVAPTLAPIAAATALEENQVVFTVGLSGASTTATTVDLALSNGTTSSADLGGLEYFNGSNWVAASGNQAIIAAGQTSVQVRTFAVADGVYEGLESFTLQASANGSVQTANGSVTDVAPTLQPIAAATALEGNQVVFTVGLSGTSTTATNVDLVLTNGTTSAADLGGLEYFDGSNWVAATGNQAVIAAGQTSVQVRTLAVADGVYEGLESFTLQATANGSTQSGQGSITDLPTTVMPILGTVGDDGIVGTAGNDVIYGNGGSDVISGGAGNDNLFAGSPTNSVNDITIMNGDGGNDILTGGTGLNGLNGTNDILLGMNEQDTLVGGGSGSINYFFLGNNQSSYYLGGGDTDYASISNFDSSVDFIVLNGSSADYSVTYAGGIASISHVDINGNQDLIAKIASAPNALNLNDSYFNYQLDG